MVGACTENSRPGPTSTWSQSHREYERSGTQLTLQSAAYAQRENHRVYDSRTQHYELITHNSGWGNSSKDCPTKTCYKNIAKLSAEFRRQPGTKTRQVCTHEGPAKHVRHMDGAGTTKPATCNRMMLQQTRIQHVP